MLLFSARRTAERGIDAEAAKTDIDRLLPMSEKVGKYEQPLPLPRSAETAAPA